MNMNVFQEAVLFDDLEKHKAGFSIDIPSLLIFEVQLPSKKKKMVPYFVNIRVFFYLFAFPHPRFNVKIHNKYIDLVKFYHSNQKIQQ